MQRRGQVRHRERLAVRGRQRWTTSHRTQAPRRPGRPLRTRVQRRAQARHRTARRRPARQRTSRRARASSRWGMRRRVKVTLRVRLRGQGRRWARGRPQAPHRQAPRPKAPRPGCRREPAHARGRAVGSLSPEPLRGLLRRIARLLAKTLPPRRGARSQRSTGRSKEPAFPAGRRQGDPAAYGTTRRTCRSCAREREEGPETLRTGPVSSAASSEFRCLLGSRTRPGSNPPPGWGAPTRRTDGPAPGCVDGVTLRHGRRIRRCQRRPTGQVPCWTAQQTTDSTSDVNRVPISRNIKFSQVGHGA